MRRQRFIGLTVLALGVALVVGAAVQAQKKSDSKVMATAKADKPDEDGKQVVTITLAIDEKFYLYANPVGHADFEENKTEVKITGKEKLGSVKVEYPAGKKKGEGKENDYNVYREKVTIKAIVQRAKGDTEPLTVAIDVSACSDKGVCLLPGTVKVTVP